jgi:hypothetical protein
MMKVLFKLRPGIFCVVTLGNVVVGYQSFRGPHSLHFQDEVNCVLKKGGIDTGLGYKREAESGSQKEAGRGCQTTPYHFL